MSNDDSRTMDAWMAERAQACNVQTPVPRPLTRAEQHLIAQVRAKAEAMSQLLNAIERSAIYDIDRRWLAIGKTNLQQGFMAVIRAIEQPEGF